VQSPYDGTQLCAQVDPEVFFPNNNFEIRRDIQTAIKICRQCPLLNQCAEYAQSQPYLYGIWGGKMYYGDTYVSSVYVSRNKRKVA
jgi:WhiB family redox-sensing transcriptional regulator